MNRKRVYELIDEERKRQQEKWAGGDDARWATHPLHKLAVLMEEVGEVAKDLQEHGANGARDELVALKRRYVRGPLLERLLARVRYERDCWIFVGHIAKISGYGQIGNDDSPSRAVFTHRASYEIFYGPITTKLHIDHLCRRRACLNPAHLEAVTQTENNRRTRRATCRRGHPRSSGRDCNECQRVRRAAQKGRTA